MHGPRAACVLVGLAVLFAAGCDRGQQSINDADKVTICHATRSASNPYTRNRVDKDGALSGHDDHPGDIIPAFTYLDKNGVQQQYPGKNLASGQAILDAGCDVPGSATSVAAGGAATTDNATKGSAPATDGTNDSSGSGTTPSRDTTPTTLAVAGPTTPTTAAVAGSTTTSATSGGAVPSSAQTEAPAATSTPTTTGTGTGQAEAEAPSGAGSATTGTAAGSADAAAPTSTGDSALADTGSTSAPMLVGALLLILAGTLGVVVARRREAT